MTEVFWYKKHDEMQKRIEELERENKRLKDYKEMWDVLKIAYDTELYGLKNLTLKKVMEDFENKYLGGGE